MNISLLFKIALLSAFSLLTQFINAQENAWLEGYVTSVDGDTLPYAHVFSNTSLQGTSTNENGKYSLKISPGTHRISVQYVGYENAERSFTFSNGERIKWEVQLQPRSVEIQEVVIKGGRNPGNEIIQQVIRKRQEHLTASTNFEAEVYIKGLYRIHDAPEKLLGRETGGIDSLLSVLNSNIIYLSETHSVFTKYRGKQKEVIQASRTSGLSTLPSINNAALLDLNFYENHPELIGKSIKSPVADDAFQHYTYRLEGVYNDQVGRKVFQIKFQPKRKVDPLLEGMIEILDQEWLIRSIDAHCDGKDINIELADSIHIKQIFHPIEGVSVWPMVQTEIFMKLSAFGFKASGGFTGIYNNYLFDPDSFTNQIDRIQMSYDSAALKKDTSFWNQTRPIELSEEEKQDYRFKDSVAQAMNDPKLLDSLEREANAFKPMDLILGYQYIDSDNQSRFSISSPLSTLGFNPVQGVYTDIEARFTQTRGKGKEYFLYQPMIEGGYGFSDQTWRYKGRLNFQWNEYDPLQVQLQYGQSLLQVNNHNPISLNANEFSNLFFKSHYIRFYESRRGELAINKNWANGIDLSNSLIYERRSMVNNTTQYSVFYKDEVYENNIPNHPDIINEEIPYNENRILKIRSTISYQPGISYIQLPDSRIDLKSDMPKYSLLTDWGIPISGTSSDYLRLEGKVHYQLQMGISGNSTWIVKGGGFPWQDQLTFFDYKHFLGNQFFLGDAEYTEDFMVLPYYRYSTNHPYFEFHWTHDFKSSLLNKVPIIRNLGFSIITKAAYLHHRDIGHYNEFSLGLDRLGWGLFRLFRVDATAAFQNGNYRDWSIMLGTKFNLSDLQG